MKKYAKHTIWVGALLTLFFAVAASSFAAETTARRVYYGPPRPVMHEYRPVYVRPYARPYVRPYYPREYVPRPAVIVRPVRPLVRPWVGVYF